MVNYCIKYLFCLMVVFHCGLNAVSGTDTDQKKQNSSVAGSSSSISVTGELKVWHKVTIDLTGPFASEADDNPNPFTDVNFSVLFTHEKSQTSFIVPGYFAADGKAAETGAISGNIWRAHFTPDKPGKWKYVTSLTQGKFVALEQTADFTSANSTHTGEFNIQESDSKDQIYKRGRLAYIGKRYLQYQGNKELFLKAGPDSPETLLAYQDFDNTISSKPKVPLHTYQPHEKDWKTGDPQWKGGKGKGLIGAINYLHSQGMNSISFLPYNAGGDGDNVWPFTSRDNKLNYDCSKLDQWGIVFAHATSKGIFLHFKLQENEIDDHRTGPKKINKKVKEALDGGQLGIERKLYCRELVARFGHALALNWNIGEENTQSTTEIQEMAEYLNKIDPYKNLIVIHTFPDQQDEVYGQLLGKNSFITGASLQNSWRVAHARTLHWIKQAEAIDHSWVVCNDEQNPAGFGVPCDTGYKNQNGTATENGKTYSLHDIRKYSLWGTLMAGGGGVEYYFGYQQPENDLTCEDFRSRENSWKYCRHALKFFQEEKLPLLEMTNHDTLIDNPIHRNDAYCLAKAGEIYLIYLPLGGSRKINLTEQKGTYDVYWFNPRTGENHLKGELSKINGNSKSSTGNPPADPDEDWLVVIKKINP